MSKNQGSLVPSRDCAKRGGYTRSYPTWNYVYSLLVYNHKEQSKGLQQSGALNPELGDEISR